MESKRERYERVAGEVIFHLARWGKWNLRCCYRNAVHLADTQSDFSERISRLCGDNVSSWRMNKFCRDAEPLIAEMRRNWDSLNLAEYREWQLERESNPDKREWPEFIFLPIGDGNGNGCRGGDGSGAGIGTDTGDGAGTGYNSIPSRQSSDCVGWGEGGLWLDYGSGYYFTPREKYRNTVLFGSTGDSFGDGHIGAPLPTNPGAGFAPITQHAPLYIDGALTND